MNGRAAAIPVQGSFQKGKTVCIFHFIRPIPHSTVHCMQHVLKEAAARRRRCGSAIDSVKEQAFLYPEHLRMMGRYNSLFGIDLSILQEPGGDGENVWAARDRPDCSEFAIVTS